MYIYIRFIYGNIKIMLKLDVFMELQGVTMRRRKPVDGK